MAARAGGQECFPNLLEGEEMLGYGRDPALETAAHTLLGPPTWLRRTGVCVMLDAVKDRRENSSLRSA